VKLKMEINNSKEIPYEPSSIPTNPIIPLYFFDDHDDEFSELREAVRDAVDYLCPQDRFIIESVYYEQVTYETLGERLGVSNVHAWRLTKNAMKNLQCQLLSNEYVTDYLNLGGGLEEQ